jgi:hemerythrin superfamily protein
MDAIEVLTQDHRKVESLFADFDRSTGPERKKDLMNEIVRELSIHAAIEEEVLYPAVREAVPEGNRLVKESLQEHGDAKSFLAELDGMDATDQGYDEKAHTLFKDVRHHVEEEEGEILPKLKEQVEPEILEDMGRELEAAKGRAPTRPHPMAPDQPPGIKVAGPVAAIVDRIRDRVQGRRTG